LLAIGTTQAGASKATRAQATNDRRPVDADAVTASAITSGGRSRRATLARRLARCEGRDRSRGRSVRSYRRDGWPRARTSSACAAPCSLRR